MFFFPDPYAVILIDLRENVSKKTDGRMNKKNVRICESIVSPNVHVMCGVRSYVTVYAGRRTWERNEPNKKK